MHLNGDDERLQITFKWFQQDEPRQSQTAQSAHQPT